LGIEFGGDLWYDRPINERATPLPLSSRLTCVRTVKMLAGV
jgi:hypothetical protein